MTLWFKDEPNPEPVVTECIYFLTSLFIYAYVSQPAHRPKRRTMLSLSLGRLSNESSVLILIH